MLLYRPVKYYALSRPRAVRSTMSYVRSDGTVGERSWWRLSIIPDFFWGTLDVLGIFFRTLIFPATANEITANARKRNPSNYTNNRGGGPGRIDGVARIKGMKDMDVPMAGG